MFNISSFYSFKIDIFNLSYKLFFPFQFAYMRSLKKDTFSFLGLVKKETFSQNFDFDGELRPVVVW